MLRLLAYCLFFYAAFLLFLDCFPSGFFSRPVVVTSDDVLLAALYVCLAIPLSIAIWRLFQR